MSAHSFERVERPLTIPSLDEAVSQAQELCHKSTFNYRLWEGVDFKHERLPQIISSLKLLRGASQGIKNWIKSDDKQWNI